MAQATSLTVLNTVTALGTDVQVNSNGYVVVKGAANSPDAGNIKELSITPSVAEVLQVDTITVNSASATVDTVLSFECRDTVNGNYIIVPVVVPAGSTDTTVTATLIAAAFNAFSSTLSVVATSSTNTVIFTAKTGFPIFLTTYYDAKMTLATTRGYVGVGSGTSLQTKWNTSAGFYTAGIYAQSANIVATTFYTQVAITLIDGSQYAILVAENLTTAATPNIANYNDLLGTYGTITGLAAGYRVTGALMATATAGAITAAVQTLTSGTLGSSQQALAGDYIVSVSTPVVHKIVGTLTETTYLASTTTALTSGSAVNIFKWRNIPA